MNKSESIKSLAAALSKFQGMVDGAKKSSSNPFYRSKYADLAEIWNTVREPLQACGLSVVQTGIPGDGDVVGIETTLIHESGEWISGIMTTRVVKKFDKQTGEAQADPQSLGSAVTYLRRYGLSAILGIHQEDDDGNRASGKKSATPKDIQKDIARIIQRWEQDMTDGWHIPDRRKASFKKHLGTETLASCQDMEKLQEYLAHIQAKNAEYKGKTEEES